MFPVVQVVSFAQKHPFRAGNHHCRRRNRVRSPSARFQMFLIAALMCLPLTSKAVIAADGTNPIVVELDRATLVRVPAKRGAIVLADPTIARATDLSASNQVVLTGLSYGETRMTVFGPAGDVVASSTVLVTEAATSGVTVYRGQQRNTYYDCARLCQPRLQLGDDDKHFRSAADQIHSREGATGREGTPAARMDSGARL